MNRYKISSTKLQKSFLNSVNYLSKEFHISKEARIKYKLEKSYFSIKGDLLFQNSEAIREFADNINNHKDRTSKTFVKASEINAIGLLEEVKHYIISLYKAEQDNKIIKNAIEYTEEKIGKQQVFETVKAFVENFPPVTIFENKESAEQFLSKDDNYEAQFEEMIILMINNLNPAFENVKELFDDSKLENTAYYKIFDELLRFFNIQNPGSFEENLLELLLAPQKNNPKSIEGQLKFVVEKWGIKLKFLFDKILFGLDLVKEESKIPFHGPGPSLVFNIEASIQDEETEQFSQDYNWMPETVMIAKSTFVWLSQLSKKYNAEINTLDKIPENELQILKNSGFNTLWLIGIWERSVASKRIKELCGNPEALSSAYSIYDYQIASELGGEYSYKILKEKCQNLSIRLAADMVPNHFGIDSKWIHDYPERFLSLDQSPYSAYSFDGENLSTNNDIDIRIEDHYYSKTDAAVVFKRTDKRTGKSFFIYHGNDGTSMPWNDTAQLDYTKPEVRQAIINTIIEVAKKFPVIRFDAAMTLAKKHFKRLWFPDLGEGGDIPTRARHGLNNDQFNRLMPKEFFREVVDAISEKAPGTLLLAEAFWLMEGYFVRTLGMHRVYNSAFMNMLKNEENEKYKQSIQNILSFDKEILKRFVNFLSNPDEETAVQQFGKEDKYFGACMMLSTLPGLPMFAHGQIEGFTEKYGMEYKKAYKNEEPDSFFIERHKKEIFPLLKLRKLFAESENFYLFDFKTDENNVNHNVFAYSNSFENKHAICFFHNKFAETEGFINTSSPYTVKNGNNKVTKTDSVINILNIPNNKKFYLIFKNIITHKEHIKNCGDIHNSGFCVKLKAFKYIVFTDFKLVYDDEGLYHSIEKNLSGNGVDSIENIKTEIKFKGVYESFEKMVNAKTLEDCLVEFKKLSKELEVVEIATNLKLKTDIELKITNFLPSVIDLNNSIKNTIIKAFCYFIVKELIKNNRLENHLDFKKTLLNNSIEIEDNWALISSLSYSFYLSYENKTGFFEIFSKLFNHKNTKNYLQINTYQNINFFKKERFETLSENLSYILFPSNKSKQKKFFKHLQKTAEISGYKVEKFILFV